MSYDQGAGIALAQFFDQQPHGTSLLRRAGIVGLSGFVESALIAYAYAMAVVVLAVGTHLGHRSPRLHGAAAPHHVVVADSLPPPCPVPSVYVLCRALLPGTDSRAVNDDESDDSRISFFLSRSR